MGEIQKMFLSEIYDKEKFFNNTVSYGNLRDNVFLLQKIGLDLNCWGIAVISFFFCDKCQELNVKSSDFLFSSNQFAVIKNSLEKMSQSSHLRTFGILCWYMSLNDNFLQFSVNPLFNQLFQHISILLPALQITPAILRFRSIKPERQQLFAVCYSGSE